MDSSIITYDRLKAITTAKKYKFFTGGPYDLNLIGIRTEDNRANTFNDFFVIVYLDDQLRPQVFIEMATTDPGLYYLHHPMRVNGTAILKPGQYPSCWTLGLHKGQYKALVQCGPMTVYRDNDRDSNLDVIPGTEETGLFDIQYHHAGNEFSWLVDRWSAGCQVAARVDDYDKSMGIINQQISHGHGRKFTYTLLVEKDFAEVA
jgi:hypothetical protein